MRTTLWFVFVILAAITRPVPAQQTQPAPGSEERGSFAFLVGTWRSEERIDHVRGTKETGDDRFEFRQTLPGGAIEGRWRFNRGSREKPDYADAIYMSGFSNATQAWSFYYVSPQSAQYWPGRKEGRVWYFTFEYQADGQPRVQRQWWEPVGADRLVRHVEESQDGGRTFKPVFTARLVRTQ